MNQEEAMLEYKENLECSEEDCIDCPYMKDCYEDATT
jgi:hypothetical protein